MMSFRAGVHPTKLLIFLIYGIQIIFEINTEEYKALKLCPLEKDKHYDRIEVVSFMPLPKQFHLM